MTDTFLVGVDGSNGSIRAAEFAADRAKRMNARLVIVYVIEWSPYTFNTPEENAERHKRREEEIARATDKVLDPLLENINSAGVSTEGVVRHGHIANVLIDECEKCGAVAMFIGRLGSSSLKTMIFGSVASNLVQTSPVPITVVP